MRFRKRFFTFLGALALLWMCGGILGSFIGYQGIAAPSDVEPNSYRIAEAVKAGTFYFCTGAPVVLLCTVIIFRNSLPASLRDEVQYILADRTIPSRNILQAQLREELRHLEQGDTVGRKGGP